MIILNNLTTRFYSFLILIPKFTEKGKSELFQLNKRLILRKKNLKTNFWEKKKRKSGKNSKN